MDSPERNWCLGEIIAFAILAVRNRNAEIGEEGEKCWYCSQEDCDDTCRERAFDPTELNEDDDTDLEEIFDGRCKWCGEYDCEFEDGECLTW